MKAATKLRRPRYVAICPDCERKKELAAVPIAGAPWPQCDDCFQSMNVYERTPDR